jgi:hypothetical protein
MTNSTLRPGITTRMNEASTKPARVWASTIGAG